MSNTRARDRLERRIRKLIVRFVSSNLALDSLREAVECLFNELAVITDQPSHSRFYLEEVETRVGKIEAHYLGR